MKALLLFLLILPACSALPLLWGDDADIAAIHADLHTLAVRVDQADANMDGKLSTMEGLWAVLGALGIGGGGVILNNRRKPKPQA